MQLNFSNTFNLAPCATLTEILNFHYHHTPLRTHIYFQNELGQEETISYEKLFKQAQKIATLLKKSGYKPGDRIIIMLPTHVGFFYSFFGILFAGCIPVPVYPLSRAQQIESYIKQSTKIFKNVEAKGIITCFAANKICQLLRAFVPFLKDIWMIETVLNQSEPSHFINDTQEMALIQYTSGSTGDPKSVLLTHENLLANIRSYGEAIQVNSEDIMVSWLPLYHDLGLIGAWLGSLYHGTPLVIMSPLTFLHHPEQWLWAIHRHRATISASPNFAYNFCAKKVDPALLSGLDLRSWRIAINAGELIDAATLENFCCKFSAYGFARESFLPMYGLAESSVGLTAAPPWRVAKIDTIERDAFEQEQQARPSENSNSYLSFVSCGVPLPRHQIKIVDKQGHPVKERQLGSLYFQGPSSLQCYYNNALATMDQSDSGWWDSDDIAYIADGEIYVVGRKKDLISKGGRIFFPDAIERYAAEIEGIRPGCVVAFSIGENGTEKLFIVAETKQKKIKNAIQIKSLIQQKILTKLDIFPDQVFLVPPHTIPKTSSGKLKRAACKHRFRLNILKTTKSVPRQMVSLMVRAGFSRAVNIIMTRKKW